MSAKLIDAVDGGLDGEWAGAIVTFSLGAQHCTAAVDFESGEAVCYIVIGESPAGGPYPASAVFGGSTYLAGSSATSPPFTVGPKQTTTVYTGPTAIEPGRQVTLGGSLYEGEGPTRDVISDGGFETGSLEGWTAPAGGASVSTTAHGGHYAAKVGPGVFWTPLGQAVTIPPSGATLEFWYQAHCGFEGHAEVGVYDLSVEAFLGTLLPEGCASGWTEVTRNLDQWAGQTVWLSFGVWNGEEAEYSSWVYYDDISVTVDPPMIGRTLTFSLGGQSCTATTDSSGHASCPVTAGTNAEPLPVGASFAGDDFYRPSASGATTVPPPRARIAMPLDGAEYPVGAVVRSSFTCTDGAGGPGIRRCLDQDGRVSGAHLDTATPGAHTYRVTATSEDGLTDSREVTYRVTAAAPPAEPSPATRPKPHGRSRLELASQSPATVHRSLHARCRITDEEPASKGTRKTGLTGCTVDAVIARGGHATVIASGRAHDSHAASTLPVTLTLTGRGRALLAAALGGVKAALRATGTATSGPALHADRKLTLFERIQRIEPPGGMFAPETAVLTPSGRHFLARVRGRLRDVVAVRCEGHTALPGAEPADPVVALALSRERAVAACGYLRSLDLHARYTTVGLGNRHQRTSDLTEADRADDRYAALTVTHG